MRSYALPILLAALALSCASSSAEKPAPVLPTGPDNRTPEEVLPGVDLSALNSEQREILASWAKATFCACGCPHTVSSCLAGHRGCHHAPRMVKFALGLVRKGASLAEVTRIVSVYYAGFDQRKKLDLSKFGPPLGNPDAQITFVVISDFTCPFCKLFVPTVEQFVKDQGEVARLYSKPFPIASHPGSGLAAQAGEWAREKGLYWEVQAALYASEDVPTIDGLVALVKYLGGDSSNLREALESNRYEEKVELSQKEARDAGLVGTPTVFINGRKIEDLSEEGLRFALEDEQEWVAHGGWERD